MERSPANMEKYLIRDILAYVAIFLLVTYLLFRCYYNYWKDRNFPYLVPSFPLGNNKQFLSKFPGPNMDSLEHYKEIRRRGLKFAGVFSMFRPILVVTDPEIVKDILVKDFVYFADRGFYKSKADPLSLTIFAMDASEWKETRIRLTPTFSSGKIKMMIPLVHSVSEQLITEINKLAEKDADIDIKEVTTSFTINTLANCALGIETKSGNDIFTEMTKKHFYPTDWEGILRFTLMNRFPELCGKLGLPFLRGETADFFRKIFRDSMMYRNKSGISRPDFLELLMKLKKQSENTSKPLPDDYLTAQVFLFFLASLDTSSGTISFALYELANNPDMQEKTREEMIQVLKNHNGQLTSDCLKDMKYLHQIINGKVIAENREHSMEHIFCENQIGIRN